MVRDLSRLLRPETIAIIGGGAWCQAVIAQLQRIDFTGDICLIHPKGAKIPNVSVYKSLDELPVPPDAAFIGINRDATIEVVRQLADMGAGGAVCFASGFAEVTDGADRNAALLNAAGDMPILGPNCYGYINAVDGALLWPDQHGCTRVDTGVAILTQSSNIAINLTMQSRALPIAYVVTCGNQAQLNQADIAASLLDDTRVTAIGVHIEGFSDIKGWQSFARKAHAKGVPVIALKVGKSQQAQTAAMSHTASMSGSDAAALALLDRFGFARVDDLETFLETLKILHFGGPLPRGNIATISCSGGEASLAADLALNTGLTFPSLTHGQRSALSDALGPRVTLANPLDYHTYIWRDTPAMTDAFSAMIDPILDLLILIVDFPRGDLCDASDWECAINAALDTKARTGGRIAMCATLPELMPEDVAFRLAKGGVIPLAGLQTAMRATDAATLRQPIDLEQDLIQTHNRQDAILLTEDTAKAALGTHGLSIPRSETTAAPAATSLTFPVVLKGMGFAHKTENNAIALELVDVDAVKNAASRIPATTFLIEEMVTGGVAEILIGVTHDPAHGFMLTLGAGGTLTELWNDTCQMMLPASPEMIKQCLTKLKTYKLIAGYRGKAAADMASIINAVTAVQDYVLANAGSVQEVEVNPLICTPTAAIAVDALIRIAHD